MAPVVIDVRPDVRKVLVISHSKDEKGSTNLGNEFAEESVSDVVPVMANFIGDSASTAISSMEVLEAKVQSSAVAKWVDAKIHPGWATIHHATFSNGARLQYNNFYYGSTISSTSKVKVPNQLCNVSKSNCALSYNDIAREIFFITNNIDLVRVHKEMIMSEEACVQSDGGLLGHSHHAQQMFD